MELVQVKICGIARIEDINSCVALGVNALGFLIGDSKGKTPTDKLSLLDAKRLISEVPSQVLSVILTHKETFEEIDNVVTYLKPNAVQLQNSSLEFKTVKSLRVKHPNIKWIKTIKVNENDTIETVDIRVKRFLSIADYILLDSAKGGSGKVHNWHISKHIVAKYEFPFVLAGGLNLQNIKESITMVNPMMVDLMSSMSIDRGIKDIQSIKKLMGIINSL